MTFVVNGVSDDGSEQNRRQTLQILNRFTGEKELTRKSHSGDGSTTILGPDSFVWIAGDSSSGITENRPRCRNDGDPWGIKRKRPTEVCSGGDATETLNRPDLNSSDSIFPAFHSLHICKETWETKSLKTLNLACFLANYRQKSDEKQMLRWSFWERRNWAEK